MRLDLRLPTRFPLRGILFLLLKLSIASVCQMIDATPARTQNSAVGFRVGFASSPTGVSYRWDTPRGLPLEASLGHSRIRLGGASREEGILERGALVLGLAAQPIWFVGDRHSQASGFYANLGGRVRYHLALSGDRFSMNMQTGGMTLTPEVVAGGGVFVRLVNAVELFGEVSGFLGSYTGRTWGGNLESCVGLRFLVN